MFGTRTFKYFVTFGIVFSLLAIPFFMGLMRPAFGVQNPYALFFAFFNSPVTFLLSGVIRSLAEFVWDSPTIQQVDKMELFISVAFWSVFGGIIGWINDVRGGLA